MALKEIFSHKNGEGDSPHLGKKLGDLIHHSRSSSSIANQNHPKGSADHEQRHYRRRSSSHGAAAHGVAAHAPGKVNEMHRGTDSTEGSKARNTPSKPLPSIDSAPPKKQAPLVYNPYGLANGGPPPASPAAAAPYAASKFSATSSSRAASSSPSRAADEHQDVLPLPVADPNEYLPAQLQQHEIDMYPTFVFPEAGSSKDRSLGDGASLAVRTVVRKRDKSVFALKKFTMFPREAPRDFYSRTAKEFIIAKSLLVHPHVVNTYGVLRTPSYAGLLRSWGFVMEYCHGDLFGLVQRSGWRAVPNEEKHCLFKQVALGIKFMHDNDIVHRDIKLENVLLTKEGLVKLTDFGVATAGHEVPGDMASPVKLSTSFVGTPPYAPPEVMYFKGWSRKRSNKTGTDVPRYDPFKMDCWGLGMLFFCIVYQGTPFDEAASSDARYREYSAAYKQFCDRNPAFRKERTKGPGVEYRYGHAFRDGGASRVAWRLCDPNPKTRYTLRDLVADEWFVGLEMCIGEPDGEDLVARMAAHKCTTSLILLDESAPDHIKHLELNNHRRGTMPGGDAGGGGSGNASADEASRGGEDTESMKKEAGRAAQPAAEDDDPSDKEIESAMKDMLRENNEKAAQHEQAPDKQAPDKQARFSAEPPRDKQTQESGGDVTGSAASTTSSTASSTTGSPAIDNGLYKPSDKVAGTEFFLRDLPQDRYCRGPVKKHHHYDVTDFVVNPLGNDISSMCKILGKDVMIQRKY